MADEGMGLQRGKRQKKKLAERKRQQATKANQKVRQRGGCGFLDCIVAVVDSRPNKVDKAIRQYNKEYAHIHAVASRTGWRQPDSRAMWRLENSARQSRRVDEQAGAGQGEDAERKK